MITVVISFMCYPEAISIHINIVYRIPCTIAIRGLVVVFLRKSVYRVESNTIIPPCAIVVPVEAAVAVELLAVVFVGLRIAAGAFAHQTAVGVVVVHLLHFAVLVGDHADVSLMVGDVEMVFGNIRHHALATQLVDFALDDFHLVHVAKIR